jgi:tetratricopeptide (TPR) repeat protein
VTDESKSTEQASAAEAVFDAAEAPVLSGSQLEENYSQQTEKPVEEAEKPVEEKDKSIEEPKASDVEDAAKKAIELPFEKKSDQVKISEDTIPPPSAAVLAEATAIGSATGGEEPPATVKAKSKKKKKKKAELRLSNVAIGVVIGVIGIAAVGAIYLFTPPPTDRVPYLLDPLEKHLDANVRYKMVNPAETKDWRHDFAVEQSIWTTEIAKITLGRGDAKPAEIKRAYQLFLADSFFKDEPHFIEAKAAYIAANLTPRAQHEKVYDMSDGDLWRRIGYCDTRLGMYGEADAWYKKALAFASAGDKYKTDMTLKSLRDLIKDNIIENDARRGEVKTAQALIDQHVKDILIKNIEDCVESPILYDQAVTYEQSGKLEKAAHFYEKAITAVAAEDRDRGVIVPESDKDNNRALAHILMSYSHVLRKLHRNPEALAAMRRALVIYDNPPR